MALATLTAEPLTLEAFAPFGHVIEACGDAAGRMNGAAFDRFDGLAPVVSADAPDAAAQVGIVRAREAASLPHAIPLIERHPLGTQAFIPLGNFRYYVVVAPAGDGVRPGDLRAFRCEGGQGISYLPGTWHMPLMALEVGQTFLVIDQGQRTGNLDELTLSEPVSLVS
ncbi:MAG: ureidoglycolate lyase [Pseudomonadota bacterium]